MKPQWLGNTLKVYQPHLQTWKLKWKQQKDTISSRRQNFKVWKYQNLNVWRGNDVGKEMFTYTAAKAYMVSISLETIWKYLVQVKMYVAYVRDPTIPITQYA